MDELPTAPQTHNPGAAPWSCSVTDFPFQMEAVGKDETIWGWDGAVPAEGRGHPDGAVLWHSLAVTHPLRSVQD